MAAPLVLLPGMNCSAALWQDALPAGNITDVVHAPLPGASVDECCDLLLRTLPERFALAGLSLGAIVAMALVRRAPQRVERLALLAANPRPPTRRQRTAWAAQRRQLAEGRTARDLQRDLLPVLLAPGARSVELDETVLAMADDIGASGLDDQLAMQATRVDERRALGRVRVPTTVVAGTCDALVGLDKHQEIADRIDGARYVVLPGAGHLSTLEAPARLGKVLSDWLDT